MIRACAAGAVRACRRAVRPRASADVGDGASAVGDAPRLRAERARTMTYGADAFEPGSDGGGGVRSQDDGGVPFVDMKKVGVSYSRSSGAGGQNVNKVATKAEMRVRVDDVRLPADALERLRESYGSRISRSNELIVSAGDHRTQRENYAACVRRLAAILRSVAVAPREWNRNSKTLGRFHANRIREKKVHSQRKAARRARAD